MNTIPAFLDTKHLTIRRAEQSQKDGFRQELEAADPQGDRLVLSKWTQDTGNTCMMGRSTLSVSYQQTGAAEPVSHQHISSDEAYDLFSALKNAPKAETGVDNMAVTFLF